MQASRQVEPQIDPGALLNWVLKEQLCSFFHKELEGLIQAAKVDLKSDESSIRKAEARWLGSRWSRRHLDTAVRHMDAVTQRQYVIDDFGRLIQELLHERQPLVPELPDTSATPLLIAARGWPSGFFLYMVMMRLCQIAMGSEVTDWDDLPPTILDPKTWQSIHENIEEDIYTARPFLAYVLGFEPVWHDWALNTSIDRDVC